MDSHAKKKLKVDSTASKLPKETSEGVSEIRIRQMQLKDVSPSKTPRTLLSVPKLFQSCQALRIMIYDQAESWRMIREGMMF